MNKIIPLFLIILLGVFYKMLNGKEKTAKLRSQLAELVLYFLLPALSFRVIYMANLSVDFIKVAVIAWAVIAFGFFISFSTSLFFKVPKNEQVGFIFGATFSNATYLGIPILTAKLGEKAIPAAFFYDFLALTPALYFLASYLSSKVNLAPAHESKTPYKRKNPFLALLKLPPVWAVFAGLIANIFIPSRFFPVALMDFLELLGRPVAPLMMICVGLGLAPIQFKELKWVLPAVGIKLLVLPSFVIVLLPFLNFNNPILAQATLFEAGLPTMLLTLVVCEAFGFGTKLLSQIIVLSTALCFLSLGLFANIFA